MPSPGITCGRSVMIGDLNDIFGVQSEISQKIGIALKVILTAEEEAARA